MSSTSDLQVRSLVQASSAGVLPDDRSDVLVAVSGGGIQQLDAPDEISDAPWRQTEIPMPAGVGTGKGVAIGDIDLDGVNDVVFSCENASGDKSGVRWLSYDKTKDAWTDHEISGPAGVKFDLLELIDLDHDGDLDVLTCEEREKLGVIWYENPTR